MRSLLLLTMALGCGQCEEPETEAPEPEATLENLPTRGLELLDPNAPVPAEVLAMVGTVPTDGLKTQMVWLGPADGDRVGIALVAYDHQTLRLAELAATGQMDAVRARMQSEANDCQDDRMEAGECHCCFSCMETARRSILGAKRAIFHLLRVSKPADGPAHLDASERWEREGRLLNANVHWVMDRDGDGRAEVDVTSVVAPRPGEGCHQAGIHERILDADTFETQLAIERDTELEREDLLTLGHRYDLQVHEENGRVSFDVHEAWWSGHAAPPDVMPSGEGRVESSDAVRAAFEAGERAWWDERYQLGYDAETDRWTR